MRVASDEAYAQTPPNTRTRHARTLQVPERQPKSGPLTHINMSTTYQSRAFLWAAAGRRVWTAAAARTKTACPWPGGARQSHAPRITIDMESAATEAPTNLVDLLPSDTIQFPVFRYPGARGL